MSYIQKGKNFNFRHFWQPSWIFAENEKCEYLENRKRYSDFERIFDPQGGTGVSYAKGENFNFIALIHPIQWTICLTVVLCTPQMAPRTSFLSRQPDVIASFSFGACTVRTCFQQSPDILRKSGHYDGFSTLFANNLL